MQDAAALESEDEEVKDEREGQAPVRGGAELPLGLAIPLRIGSGRLEWMERAVMKLAINGTLFSARVGSDRGQECVGQGGWRPGFSSRRPHKSSCLSYGVNIDF